MRRSKQISQPVRSGLGFGITSGVITTLGLTVGLDAGTGSRLAVLGGIFTIAVADAFSDALGMHISQESDVKNTQENVWTSTFTTFFAKFFVALMFAIPVLFLPLQDAIIACVVLGTLLLSSFSYYIAIRNNEKPFHVVSEHLAIAAIVLVASAIVGNYIAMAFGP